jgi:transcriptional regulator with XRE-family HTH domain
LARLYLEQSQTKCAKEIAALAGEDTGGQQALSSWECGKCTPDSPGKIAAIRQYVDNSALRALIDRHPVGLRTVATIHPIHGGPAPGTPPTQARLPSLDDAIQIRIQSGSPLSEWDWKAIKELRGER